MIRAAFVVLLALMPLVAAAQVVDGFEDGDFAADPVWTGDDDRWHVVARDGSRWLNTNGSPESDTLVLATASAVSYGIWRFTLAHAGVNLSNANGVRVYLVSDRADLRGSMRGYFLQMGTNNADEMRLYRQDGPADESSNRVEIGRSGALLAGDDGEYEIEVERTPGGTWTVRVDGAVAFTASDDTYAASTHFGFWVKHSSSAAQSHFFDNVEVAGTTGPPDTTPPAIVSDLYDEALPGFVLDFSEPLDPSTLNASDFSLSSGDVLTLDESGDPARVRLRLPSPLATGSYSLSVRDLADASGNILRDTSLTYAITRDTDPPVLLAAVATAPDLIFVRFSEVVVNACDLLAYTLQPAEVTIVGSSCLPGTVTDTLTLWLSAALHTGAEYTLTASALEDEAGNVQASTSSVFRVPEQPAPGDVVVNEIMYAPPSGLPEYVELFNASAKTLDLSRFTLADDTGTAREITDTPTSFLPGSYVVVTRDQAALSAAFPGLQAIQPDAWPALNNGGDAVLLRAGKVGVDSVAYSSAWGGAGAALERRDPEAPPNNAANWGTSSDSRGGTPGVQNSLYAPDLDGPRVLRVEETAAQTLDVTFSEAVDPASVSVSAFALDNGTVQSSTQITEHIVRLTFASAASPASVSVRGVRDLKGNVLPDTTLSIAFRPQPGEIVVNEILFVPLADPADNLPDQPEYVELINRGMRTLTLRGIVIADATDETGVADTLRLPDALPPLPPGGFAVVFDADDGVGDPATASTLARAFPSIEFTRPGIALIPVPTVTRNGLTNSGERLHLIAGGVTLDDVTFRPGWKDASLSSAEGIALERIRTDAPPSDPLNWASSAAPEGGTPGRPNSVMPIPDARRPQPGDLVINEVMYQPVADARDDRPDQTEYVELFNRSGDVLDLNGLLLLDAPDESGDADTVRLAYRPSPLSPGGYAVLYRVSGLYAETEEPSALLTEAFPGVGAGVLLPQREAAFSLPDGGRLLRLVAPDGTVLDEITYAPGWHLPSLRSAAGVALERISVDAPSGEPSNWSSSPSQSGGTPGARNGVTLDPNDPDAPAQVGVTASPSPFSPDGDGTDDQVLVRYRLNSPAASIRVRIFDQGGRLVRTLTQAQPAGPTGQVVWDGRDDDGRALRVGIYIVLLEALDVGAGATETFRVPVVLARPL